MQESNILIVTMLQRKSFGIKIVMDFTLLS